jgi:uncharacterized sulfatase
LGRILRALERAGELSNTLVVVTSDNGMPFPGAKATMYEYGIHLPLAICWPDQVPGGRTVSDVVSFTDYAPTFLEAAGVAIPSAMTGRSLLPVLRKKQSGQVDPSRTFALSGRERHSHARFDNLGYPARALRTQQYLYIRNFEPERWPAGDPEGYHDIDASPTKTWMMKHRDDANVRGLFDVCFGKHGEEQLYDIRADSGCLRNLAATHDKVRKEMRAQLDSELTRLRDPRMSGNGHVWESYPRFSPMRPELGGFAEEGKYNPKYRR